MDHTRIAVRERAMLEVIDLSLHVARAYAKPLIITFALAALPFMVMNYLLIGWMADPVFETEFPYRFVWNMMLLIVIEAPLASIFATCYLGQAVFQERPSIRQVMRDVLKLAPRIAWCQLIVRGVLPVCILYALVERFGDVDPLEALLVPLIALAALAVRSVRPFINEIIVLERNPLRSKDRTAMTIGRRSQLLHGPSSGDLVQRSMMSGMVAYSLFIAIYGILLFASGTMFHQWRQGPLMVQLGIPLSMWFVAGFFTVVRFLAYLDTRIRQEGWEVELRLRAEAAKLTSKMT